MSEEDRQRIGPFRLLEAIGEGGMGSVWRAEHTHLRSECAVKVIELGADAVLQARFPREARAVGRLRHDHIVHTFDAGVEGDRAYLAMALVPGGSLDAWLRRGYRPSVEEILEILRQVAAALDHAHAHDIVHRDLKPGNVLIEETEHGLHCWLTDFGLAKIRDATHPITDPASGFGTPAYMAPEQFVDSAAVDGRCDVYALGVLAFRLLTGRAPFLGPRPRDFAFQHMSDLVPAPSQLRDGLPSALDGPLLTALAKAPEDRPPTAGAFVEALAVAVREASSPGSEVAEPDGAEAVDTAPSTETAATVTAPTLTAPTAPEAPAPTPGRRRGAHLAWRGAVAASVLLLALGAGLVTRAPGAPADVLRCALRDGASCAALATSDERLSTPASLARAASRYRRGCDAGHGESCVALGNLLDSDRAPGGATITAEQLEELFREGCDRGSQRGCINLAVLLAGRVDRNPELASEVESLLRTACEAGELGGCSTLGGWHLERGRSGEALGLVRSTCERGDAGGCFYLGLMHERGLGVARDAESARRLYRRACDGGNELACEALRGAQGARR